VHSFDFNSLETSKNLICISEHPLSKMRKFILTIETFNKILSNREKYVVFTYLYCEKKQIDTLLHLDKKIALILNTSEGNIRKIKSTAYDKVRKFLSSDG
jgi:DNA-directed RNA polymerase sigma subunit (sigma70/sigma32)